MTAKRRMLGAVLAAAVAALAMRGFAGDRGAPQGEGGPAAGDRTAGSKGAGSGAAGSEGRLVVHEWGTFTSFSGSDGVKLEFRPLLDADLPSFVLNRPRQAGAFNPLSKTGYPVLARMETPVTYFYTDRARSVNVRVGFPRGLLTEFFPPVAAMKPAFTGQAQPVGNSELDWGTVRLLPEHAIGVETADRELAERIRELVLTRLPPASEGWFDHYGLARKTDSALVYVEREADPQRPHAPHGAWFEKFLFYRGVGNFELPLELTARPGGRFELVNRGREPIRSLFLVTVEDQNLRFTAYDEIGAGGRMTLTQTATPANIDALAAEVQRALVRAGLYEKEATAMVATWRSSWFGEQGTRLFYLLPERLTDELLPLSILPAPDEQLRVMVGRLEIMRPEDEARVTEAVRKNAQDRAAAMKTERAFPETMPEAIVKLGRLAEPGLARVKSIAADEIVRNEAALLLKQLLGNLPP